MRGFRNLLPLLLLLGLFGCAYLAVAVLYIAIAATAFIASVLICNPFNLLDNVVSARTRWCTGLGILSCLGCCILPVNGGVRFLLGSLGVSLFVYGCKFNSRMMGEGSMCPEAYPIDDYRRRYRPSRVEIARQEKRNQRASWVLSAFRAPKDNLGAERRHWRESGLKETQDALLRMGRSFTERELWTIGEPAYILGLLSTRRQNGDIEELRRTVQELRSDNTELTQQLESYKKAYASADEELRAVSNQLWEAERYMPETPELEEPDDWGHLSPADIAAMIRDGWTGKQIAEKYGVSPSQVSRKKAKAENGALW